MADGDGNSKKASKRRRNGKQKDDNEKLQKDTESSTSTARNIGASYVAPSAGVKKYIRGKPAGTVNAVSRIDLVCPVLKADL